MKFPGFDTITENLKKKFFMAANTVITSAETAAAQIEGNLLKAVSLEEAAYSRDQILGRNPDKSRKSFLPCHAQSPLRLCLGISTSSNSLNLLQFLEFSYYTLLRR
jgi:hypothetical protein